jgi:hypothetical protein
MTYIGRTKTVNDLMIDLRAVTGDSTYSLTFWRATEVELAAQLWNGKAPRHTAISPRLTLGAMEDYLTAYTLGVEAGSAAAKRGR